MYGGPGSSSPMLYVEGKRRGHSHVCSTVVLCCAAVAALVAVAITAIAFGTDNWQHIQVDREVVIQNVANTSTLETDERLFSRVRGLFRTCFPHRYAKPKQLEGLYLNPVEEWCVNVDYYLRLLDYALVPPGNFTQNAINWFHIARAAIAAFCLYFMWMGISMVTGLLGCWRADGDHLVTTATLMLLAALSGAVGMGCWHWAQFFEKEKVYDERLQFFPTWPIYMKEATTFSFGWSYMLAWVGIGLSLVASILFTASALCLRTVLREQEHQEMLLKLQMTYPSLQNTLMRHGSMQPLNINHTETLGRPTGLGSSSSSVIASDRVSLPGGPMSSSYYPAGYPVHYDEAQRSLQYKNVVKELEDAKL